MAEPIGLALGTVALSSLFSTCIELIDYFELSRSFEYDYDQACLKLALLRHRLSRWRESFRECDIFQDLHMQEESRTVSSSLQGIAGILGNAESLKKKYCLARHQRLNWLPTLRSVKNRSAETPRRQISARICGISFLQQTVTWAIRDKQKFDNLIADLEFFISNLEVVAWQSSPRASFPLEESMEKSNENGSKDAMETRAVPTGTVANTGLRKADPATTRQAAGKEHVPNASTPSSSTSRSTVKEGCQWWVGTMEEKSRTLFGTVGDAELKPAPKGQAADFKVTKMAGEATLVGGAMDRESFNDWTNGPARSGSSSKDK